MQVSRAIDVLVVGAGPAGSAAARVLAGAGVRVLLADRHAFPRDKVCGDALIPDALHALDTLGLRDRVARAAHVPRAIRIYAPDGRFVTLRGECAALPRATLDDLLRRAALEAGAEFLPYVRATRALELHGVVTGAAFEDVRTGDVREIGAETTILATGAAGDVLRGFRVSVQTTASAMAARLYVRTSSDVASAHDYLAISYPASLCPGYGWVFPGPSGVFNIGIGYLIHPNQHSARRNLRSLLAEFTTTFPPAVEVMHAGEVVSPLKGAPLRTGLRGAQLSRAGLLVVGEAAGLTYSFTGEGIGKALESGIAAARAILETRKATNGNESAAARAYAAVIRSQFNARFAAYRRLERLLSYPPMVNLLVRRANAGSYVRAQLEALINETGRPDGLLSLSGAVRALLT